VKAPSPSAVIGLREALTGEARATRVRALATPSWLATRTRPVFRAARGAPSRCSRDRSGQRHQPGARNRPPLRRGAGRRHGLLRPRVHRGGCEDVEDLWSDLDSALKA
jgi:hypothetical protein